MDQPGGLVKLSDQIIEHGPYATGQPVGWAPWIAGDAAALNELREELIAGRQARGLDGATPTIHTSWAEFRTDKFWDERINSVAAAHGFGPVDAIHNASASGQPNCHMLRHPDGRLLLIIWTDQEDA
jgi:hypothetical protein